MTVHLPQIGVTHCQRAVSLVEKYPQNIVGSFWVMCGYGFEYENIPNWWISNVLKDNQAQGIIDIFEKDFFHDGHDNPLYLGFCIIVIADPSRPGNLSYLIQHLRMENSEGIELLRLMAKHHISAHTEVTYPEYFLKYRYGDICDQYRHFRETLDHWTIQVWEDYCSYLMAEHGQGMLSDYLEQINIIRDAVKATVENSSKPLILTEGETDPIYIRAALKLLGEQTVLEQVDVKWVGASVGKGRSINTGDSGLNSTRNVLFAHPEFINSQKVMLLYDSDTGKDNKDLDKLTIRKIPKRENAKIKKGIENLFPDELFTENFYSTKTKYGNYGEESKIQEFQKMRFCKWICEQRRQSRDFSNFKPVIEIIKEFLNSISDS
jgi:hypothetical protein